MRVCPDCGDPVEPSEQKYLNRRVFECCNYQCGLRYCYVKDELIKLEYKPWDKNIKLIREMLDEQRSMPS